MSENEEILRLNLKINQLENEIAELKDADKFWDSINNLEKSNSVDSRDDFLLQIFTAEALIAQNDLLHDIASFAVDNQISLKDTTL